MMFFFRFVFFNVLFLMTLLSTGVSQSTVVHSELFKIQKLENLPENDVNCVFKDSKGFMWIVV